VTTTFASLILLIVEMVNAQPIAIVQQRIPVVLNGDIVEMTRNIVTD